MARAAQQARDLLHVGAARVLDAGRMEAELLTTPAPTTRAAGARPDPRARSRRRGAGGRLADMRSAGAPGTDGDLPADRLDAAR